VKKVLLIVLPLVLVIGLGTVLGLGYMGVIHLPFFPHKKVVKKAGKQSVALKPIVPVKKADPTPPPPAAPPRPKPVVNVPKPDVEAGEKKLAHVWDGMESAQLVPILQDWKDPELARILIKMDPDKVTELLATIDPARASKLSRAIEAAAAKPKPALLTGA
jgi:hypothetical protein